LENRSEKLGPESVKRITFSEHDQFRNPIRVGEKRRGGERIKCRQKRVRGRATVSLRVRGKGEGGGLPSRDAGKGEGSNLALPTFRFRARWCLCQDRPVVKRRGGGVGEEGIKKGSEKGSALAKKLTSTIVRFLSRLLSGGFW